MSTIELSTSGGDERQPLRLIESINQLPFRRVLEGEAYVVSGAAMNEILEELHRLWNVREAVADLVRTSKDSSSG